MDPYTRNIQLDYKDIVKIKNTKHSSSEEIKVVERIADKYLLDEHNAWVVVKQIWRNDGSLLMRNDR
jgi:hypothetical protein